ncbi:hypothetical protein [uncultured Hymenobacter sp.]|uniref:hypothetical protein n=1 Tax=uncultured Hymenobacter sp. TaxID=170016 RepID=UPI0035C98543
MKVSSAKRSKKKPHPRQAIRDARKAARPVFAPGEAELYLVTEDGREYYRLNHVSIPGYTYAF